VFITVRVEDCQGQLVPTAKIPFQVRVDLLHEQGPPGQTGAALLATDNGDPTDFTPFPSARRHTFNGLGLAIVRGQPGAFTVTISSPGAPAATLLIRP